MTDLQKVLVRKSEIRERLTELGAVAEPTDEQSGEVNTLTGEYRTLEVRERALIVAGDEPAAAGVDEPGDGEAREFRELNGRVSLGRYMEAVVTEKRAAGAERELREAMGLGDNVVPWSAIAPREDEGRSEHRAVSAAPANVGIGTNPILERVFRRSDSMFLGVSMPSVGVGQQNYPVFTSAAAEPLMKAKDAAAGQPAVTFTGNVLTPTRLTSQYLWRREDAAVFAGMEEALRGDLSMAMSQAMDAQVVSGNGTAPNVDGFLSGDGLGNGVDQAGDVQDYSKFIAGPSGQVDGIYAYMLGDVRALVPVTVYQQMAGAFANAGKGDVSAADYLRMNSGGLRVSGHISNTVASKKLSAIYAKGPAGAAVAPVWEGVTLIRDEITQAAKGQVLITAVALWAFKLLRPAQYRRALIQVQA